jgi:hypothetical protein
MLASIAADNATTTENAIQQLLADTDKLTTQRQELLGTGLPVSEFLQYIQSTTIAPTTVTAIDIDTEKLTVEGENGQP